MNLNPNNIVLKELLPEDFNTEDGSSFRSSLLKLSSSIQSNVSPTDRVNALHSEVRDKFFRHDYIGILFLLPTLFQYNYVPGIPGKTRIIIGSTLFRLGRVKPALREIMVTIELEPRERVRKSYLGVLALVVSDMDKKEDAIACLGEVIDLMKRHTEKQEDLQELKSFVLSSEKELAGVESINENCANIWEVPEVSAQLTQFEKLNKRFPVDTFTGQCQVIFTKINQSWEMLGKWKDCGGHHLDFNEEEKLPLILIQEAILLLGPIIVYNSLLQFEPLILDYLDYAQKNSHNFPPSLKRSSSFKFAMQHLVTKKQLLSHNKTWLQCTIVRAFLDVLHEDYSAASSKLQVAANAFDSLYSQKGVLTRNIHVLLIKCKFYIEGNNKRHLDKLADELLKLSPIKNVQSTGKIFILLGMIKQKLAILDANQITIHKPQNSTTVQGSKLLDKYSKEAITAYISGVCSLYDDDQYIPIIYDRILFLLLLIGGIHFNAFMFFRNLRDYFTVKANYHYLAISYDSDLDKYGNLFNIIRDISKLYEIQKNKLTSTLKWWEESTVVGNSDYFLPQVYLGEKDALYMSNKIYHSPHEKVFTCDNSQEQKDWGRGYLLVPMKKSNLKIPHTYYKQRLDLSRSLIRSWYDSYKEIHGSIPVVIQMLFDKYYRGN